MKRKIIELLKKSNTLPFLFAGSGISRRYLNIEDWEGLLKKFAKQIDGNEFGYNVYKQKAIIAGYEEGILPKIAELIEHDFNTVWYQEDRFDDNRMKHIDDIEAGSSPFKMEIADYMKDESSNLNSDYKDELDLLKQLANKSIAGVITTNYDTLLEDTFTNFTKYVGQEELIFSSLLGISEIYKIHGCATQPDSIVINEKDYKDFSERYAYLAAKLMTIFLEHPIIFIGYSISDKNIESILKSIVKCLSQKHLEQLKERLIFIEWCKSGEEDISTYSKAFEGNKSIDMTRVKLNDFSVLYEALLDNKAKYNVSMLRQIKEDIYDLVITNTPTSKLRVIGLEDDDKLDQVEVVVGVGVLSEFGQKGYLGVSADELYEDVIMDSGDFDIERIIKDSLPILLPRNSKVLPMFKYLKDYDGVIPRVITESMIHTFDDLLSATIIKNRDHHSCRNKNLDYIQKEYSIEKCLQITPHMKPENIDVQKLKEMIEKLIKDNPNVLSDKENQNLRSDLKRVIRIYDFLKYGNQAKEIE